MSGAPRVPSSQSNSSGGTCSEYELDGHSNSLEENFIVPHTRIDSEHVFGKGQVDEAGHAAKSAAATGYPEWVMTKKGLYKIHTEERRHGACWAADRRVVLHFRMTMISGSQRNFALMPAPAIGSIEFGDRQPSKI
ncbi:hypothetical protein ARMSODRAFT_999836 [Armillaria solidipes]|uniref:Uncharacterized protein n=1 Tax=Armillaria solidipes TaxID=1076256 RepID=A0A2H3BWX5_9AGAR|nr:hypothetical protein ARMSODRAFT_999836 [Armillaria solidipes]